jgi:hypothetical protein
MTQDTADQALQVAQSAITRIDNHEEICAIQLAAILAKIGELKKVMAWSAGIVASVVLTSLGWTVVYIVTSKDNHDHQLEAQIAVLQGRPPVFIAQGNGDTTTVTPLKPR